MIGLILFVILILFFYVFQVDLNPTSSSPIAAPQSKIGFYKIILKFLLPLYVVVDYQ